AVEENLKRRHRVVTRDLPKGAAVRRASEVQYLESEREHKRRVNTYAVNLAASIDRALDVELSLINLDGLATEEECRNPTDRLVRRLLAAASDSERERRDQLRASHARGESVKRTESESSVEEDTNSPL